MIEYKSPEKYDDCHRSVFLGGSLTLEYDWRREIIERFKTTDAIFLNPHRDDIEKVGDDVTDNIFVEHVVWVNNAIEDAWTVFLYFDPKTESPMSLLDFAELCKYKNTIVCCPDGFWKKTLIKSACIEFNVPMFDDLEDAICELEKRL